jgi:hypothetical protein
MSQPATISFRDQMRDVADRLGVNLDDVLMMSPKRDPLNCGTTGDHKKAEWFTELWREAVAKRDSDSIHVRGLHYTIVQMDRDIEPPTGRCSWEKYVNIKKCHNYLGNAASIARVLGYVPLGGIDDEKNNQERTTHYTGHDTLDSDGLDNLISDNQIRSPSIPSVDSEARFSCNQGLEQNIRYIAYDIAKSAKRRQTINIDEQQPFHIEIWSEKTLPSSVRSEAKDAGVDTIVEGEGHLSYRIAHDFMQRVEEADKQAVILYLTDFDPAGEKMPKAMASKVKFLKERGDLEHRVQIKRLGLTAEQVERLGLPRKPVKTDSQSYLKMIEDWQNKHGDGGVELQALEKDIDNYCRIIRDAVLSYSDDTLSDQVDDVKQDFYDEVKQRVIDSLTDSELDDKRSDVEDWMDDFNEALSDASDQLEELSEIAHDDVIDEWDAIIDDAVADVDLPDLDIPEGDADPAANPLYDTDRPYIENIAEVTGSDPRD